MISFPGVAFVGVIEGIFIAIARALLVHYGTLDVLCHGIFYPTVGRAANLYRERYAVDCADWDES